MKTFVAALKPHVLYDEQESRYPDGKSKDVDVGKNPILVQVPISDTKVVNEHNVEGLSVLCEYDAIETMLQFNANLKIMCSLPEHSVRIRALTRNNNQRSLGAVIPQKIGILIAFQGERCYRSFQKKLYLGTPKYMKMQYYLLSLLAGVAVAIQTGVNSQLRQDTNNPIFTALLSFSTGTVALIILYFIFFRQSPAFPQGYSFEWWKFTGGLCGVLYITAVVIAAPRIGAANALGLIVIGQFSAAIIIDHFGWMGMPMKPITFYRIGGIVLLLAGAYLIQKN
jgi:transporter family-2 protein